MARTKALPQFGKYDAEKLMYEVDRAGTGVCIESQFRGSGYIIKRDSIVILGGKNGVFTVDLDEFTDFVWELIGVYEFADAREKAGIKSNFYNPE